MSEAKPRQVNASVDNAFDVLRLFSSIAEPLTVTDISRELSLSFSTTYRVVTTLCEMDFLEQRPDKRYEPGIRVRELLLSLYDMFPVRAASIPTLRKIAETTGQAVTLSVPLGYHALKIAGIQDQQYLHRPLLIGELRPLWSGCTGELILAFQPGEFVDEALGLRDAKPDAEMRARIGQMARDGYGHHFADGLRTLVFPVCDDNGTAIAAIAVEGASVQFAEPGRALLDKCRKLIGDLEAVIRAQPWQHSNPFQHLPNAEITLVHRP